MMTVDQIDKELAELRAREKSLKQTDPGLIRAHEERAALKETGGRLERDDEHFLHRSDPRALRVGEERTRLNARIAELEAMRLYAGVTPGRSLDAIRADLAEAKQERRAIATRMRELKSELEVAIEIEREKAAPVSPAKRAAQEIALRGIPTATKFGRMG